MHCGTRAGSTSRRDRRRVLRQVARRCGAEVVKVEPPSGHPSGVGRFRYCRHRRRSRRSAFRYLAAGQDRSSRHRRRGGATRASRAGRAKRHRRREFPARPPRGAWAGGRGPAARESGARRGLDHAVRPERSRRDDRGRVPAAGAGRLVDLHGDGAVALGGGRAPRRVGRGTFAAAGALAGRAAARRTGRGEHVDVSSARCLAVTFMCYPPVFAALAGRTRRRGCSRWSRRRAVPRTGSSGCRRSRCSSGTTSSR